MLFFNLVNPRNRALATFVVVVMISTLGTLSYVTLNDTVGGVREPLGVEGTETVISTFERIKAHFPVLSNWADDVERGIADESIKVFLTADATNKFVMTYDEGALNIQRSYFEMDPISQEEIVLKLAPIQPGLTTLDPEIAIVPK